MAQLNTERSESLFYRYQGQWVATELCDGKLVVLAADPDEEKARAQLHEKGITATLERFPRLPATYGKPH